MPSEAYRLAGVVPASLFCVIPTKKSAAEAMRTLVAVAQIKNNDYLCNANARMAESVDAPVSNTGGATHPGSIPGPGTEDSLFESPLLFYLPLLTHWSAHR